MAIANSSTSLQSGTAASAKAILALSLCSYPALASQMPPLWEQDYWHIHGTISSSWPGSESISRYQVEATTQAQLINPAFAPQPFAETERKTTEHEKIAGAIREWALLSSNWDGEGASKPNQRSLREATIFLHLLDRGMPIPEPMLLASGHASLFWHDVNLYAELEFLGDGHIAYFIERSGDKHKGVLKFDSKNMPPVFQALL